MTSCGIRDSVIGAQKYALRIIHVHLFIGTAVRIRRVRSALWRSAHTPQISTGGSGILINGLPNGLGVTPHVMRRGQQRWEGLRSLAVKSITTYYRPRIPMVRIASHSYVIARRGISGTAKNLIAPILLFGAQLFFSTLFQHFKSKVFDAILLNSQINRLRIRGTGPPMLI